MKNKPAASTKTQPEDRIPAQTAERLRALLHDLGNALEIVVQAEYLLSNFAELSAENQEWLGLLRKGTQQAMVLNQTLRDEVRRRSESA